MKRCPIRSVSVAALFAIGLSGAVSAAEQRSCSTDFAIFPNGNQERLAFRVIIAASEKAAKVRVSESGEWAARRTQRPNGADTFVFETRAAKETLTIGPNGELLWEIAYKDPEVGRGLVIAYVGTCGPWKAQ